MKQVFKKGVNVTILFPGQVPKHIPLNRSRFEQNVDGVTIKDIDSGERFNIPLAEAQKQDGSTFADIDELVDYVSDFVGGFNDGGGTGEGGTYEPSFTIDFFTPNSLNAGISTPQRVTVKGSFLDYVETASFNSNDSNGISVSIVSKTFDTLELDVVVSSINQDININLTSPSETKSFVIPVKNQRVIIPSNSGTGESLWKRGTTSGNQAVTGTGTFEAQNNGGNGWNEHAYYGTFTNPITEIQHEFTITRLNGNSDAYVYIHFDQTAVATSGNVLPRLSIFQGGNNNDFTNINGNNIALPNLFDGDNVKVIINATSFVVIVNNQVVSEDNNDYSSILNNVNLSFTAFRVFAISNLKTTIIE